MIDKTAFCCASRRNSRAAIREPLRGLTTVAAFFLAAGIGANATCKSAVANTIEAAGKITVCVNPNNYVFGFVLARAEWIASRILASAGVALEWHLTGRGPCQALPSVRNVVMDFSRDTPAAAPHRAMAFAKVYGDRVLVLYDRIERSSDSREELSTLLGHVMAHEIAHILQSISRHSQAGIMKATWDARDCWQMMYKPLPFAPEDIDLIQRGCIRRTAASPPGYADFADVALWRRSRR